MLLGINAKEKPKSVSKLFDWIVAHPGPEAAASAAKAVQVVRSYSWTNHQTKRERELSIVIGISVFRWPSGCSPSVVTTRIVGRHAHLHVQLGHHLLPGGGS